MLYHCERASHVRFWTVARSSLLSLSVGITLKKLLYYNYDYMYIRYDSPGENLPNGKFANCLVNSFAINSHPIQGRFLLRIYTVLEVITDIILGGSTEKVPPSITPPPPPILATSSLKELWLIGVCVWERLGEVYSEHVVWLVCVREGGNFF